MENKGQTSMNNQKTGIISILLMLIVLSILLNIIIAGYTYKKIENIDNYSHGFANKIEPINNELKELKKVISETNEKDKDDEQPNEFGVQSYDTFMQRFSSYVKTLESMNNGSVYLMPAGKITSQVSTEFSLIGNGENLSKFVTEKIRSTNSIYNDERKLHHIVRIQVISSEVDNENLIIQAKENANENNTEQNNETVEPASGD